MDASDAGPVRHLGASERELRLQRMVDAPRRSPGLGGRLPRGAERREHAGRRGLALLRELDRHRRAGDGGGHRARRDGGVRAGLDPVPGRGCPARAGRRPADRPRADGTAAAAAAVLPRVEPRARHHHPEGRRRDRQAVDRRHGRVAVAGAHDVPAALRRVPHAPVDLASCPAARRRRPGGRRVPSADLPAPRAAAVGPALASLAIFEFLWVWNDLLLASTFVSGDADHAPVTLYLSYLNGSLPSRPDLLSAGTVVAVALPLVVFFALQRYYARGLLAGAIVE